MEVTDEMAQYMIWRLWPTGRVPLCPDTGWPDFLTEVDRICASQTNSKACDECLISVYKQKKKKKTDVHSSSRLPMAVLVLILF
jgi:tartrate dehydratase alpha subunit/fumarate hydratase class I-like protein